MVLLEAIYVDRAGQLRMSVVIHIVIGVFLVRLVTFPPLLPSTEAESKKDL